MLNLKTLAILMLSAQIVLAATDVNFEKPNIFDILFPETAENNTNQNNTPETRVDGCSLYSSDAGIGRLLREAKSLQPTPKIQQLIVDRALRDKQVFNLIRVKRDMDKYINNLKRSAEFAMLLEYACQQLNLDASMMMDFVESFLSVGKAQPDLFARKGRPGVRGLLQDIQALVPQQKTKALYQQLLVQDPLLSTAVQRLETEEYRQLLRNLHLNPDLLELRKQLVNAGVPVLELHQLVNVALGWA